MMEEGAFPKYILLKKEIICWIIRGHVKAHELLIPEKELADRFHISRHTVRQSINELIQEGWLYRIRGKGIFCADPSFSRMHAMEFDCE